MPAAEALRMIPQQARSHSTMRTAEAALAEITARGQAADPRSFALWYNFVAGESGLLTTAVNEKLARNGRLTTRDVDDIHAAHISPGAPSERVDRVGAKVADEIEQVIAMVEAAEGSASSYSANLATVSKRLGTAKDRAGIRSIVEGLVLSTREMEASNAELQVRLQAMWGEIARLRGEIETIRNESLTDALTSLGNRKFLNAALEKSVAQARGSRQPLTLLLADVDHFKKINDTYGHVVGDRVLQFVAKTLKSSLKGQDIAARYGGEEFAIVLPNTSIETATGLADRLRQAIMKGELVKQTTGEKRSALTISIGVAALHERASAQSLIEAADACLYAAKRSGRNCVVSETDERLLDAVAR
jgi:diguanylate cyclase